MGNLATVRAKVRAVKKINDFFCLFIYYAGVFLLQSTGEGWDYKSLHFGWTYYINTAQVVAENKLGKSCDSFYQRIEELYFKYFFVFNTKELVLGIKLRRGKK